MHLLSKYAHSSSSARHKSHKNVKQTPGTLNLVDEETSLNTLNEREKMKTKTKTSTCQESIK